MNILVCDDDKSIVDALGVYLENEGYAIFKAFNGLEAIDIVERQEIHLIIMDIMMPKMDGISATIKIREDKKIPLIMLSAKSEDSDKILGLNLGADDYITKPFNPLELIARVKSQLRRYTTFGSLETKSNVYQTGGLMIDDERKTVTVDGEEVHLTPVQYKILKLLTANAGKVFSIEEIYEKVWNETAFSPENTVTVHIRKIREKIEINPKEPKYLKVVWGVGYKVEKL
ncbi:response regulator transcription factor [Ammoniphilus sp. YIM 78166]|uniref:response regulator transcription factor n=1 Tax=Ammoniphilus sp. YIM 78166 TaxID=1644106 RepID=UPI00106F99CD|nr:response regulator transcription factor [Ammoniphilus sp. YIM 78166]